MGLTYRLVDITGKHVLHVDKVNPSDWEEVYGDSDLWDPWNDATTYERLAGIWLATQDQRVGLAAVWCREVCGGRSLRLFSEHTEDEDRAPYLNGYREDPLPGYPGDLREGWTTQCVYDYQRDLRFRKGSVVTIDVVIGDAVSLAGLITAPLPEDS